MFRKIKYSLAALSMLFAFTQLTYTAFAAKTNPGGSKTPPAKTNTTNSNASGNGNGTNTPNTPSTCPTSGTTTGCPTLSKTNSPYSCGAPPGIATSIDFGCEHKGSPLLDLIFSIIRILSDGVGIVIAASMTYAGIQYIASAGDPNGVATAIKRIRSNVLALLLYIFGYGLINYLIPGQILK